MSEARWDGKLVYTQTDTFAPSILQPGVNSLTVKTDADTGAVVNRLYVNWLEIDYQAGYTALNNQLSFGTPGDGAYQFRVAGFGNQDISIFDISNPNHPSQILNIEKQSAVDRYTAVFEDRATAASRYLALTTDQYRTPISITTDSPSDLRNPANGADEIIITYDDFYEDILPLIDLRKQQRMRVQVVKISDVYDEFNGGVFTPQAIRDFVSYAYFNWEQPAPAYILLVGDGHLDYLNRFNTGKPIYIPPHVFDTDQVGETSSDMWYVEVDGEDALPDLAIGRLPANNRSDVQAMVAKIIGYEAGPVDADWRKNTLYVSDDDEEAFESDAEAWLAQLPDTYQSQQIFVSHYPPGDPTEDMISAINNQGVFLMTYVGHGNFDRWGTWGPDQTRLFQTSDVSLLTNGEKLPFLVTATCLNGFFSHPKVDYSIAEELTRKANGGAIGVWSPSALAKATDQKVLFAGLYDSVFRSSSATLGTVTTQAKLFGFSQGLNQELLEAYILFGDPATRLFPTENFYQFLPMLTK